MQNPTIIEGLPPTMANKQTHKRVGGEEQKNYLRGNAKNWVYIIIIIIIIIIEYIYVTLLCSAFSLHFL